MLKGFAVTLVASLLAATPAAAFEVQEAVLQVSFTHGGREYVLAERQVPLLPANACYNWYIRLAESDTALNASERLSLPQAIDWGTVATDPNDGIEVLEKGTVAISTLNVTTDEEGWFTHGWCVAEGDPLGAHSMAVSADGQQLAVFDFELVDPNKYVFPAAPSAPWAMRSANQVW